MNKETDILGFQTGIIKKADDKTLDFRLLDNYNWFFIGLLWLVLVLQWKQISFWHGVTFIVLLAIYSCVHLYNSLMNGDIKNNEIVTMAIINVFACIPLLYYIPGFESETWILLLWASIAVSTFNEMRDIVLILFLLCSFLVFMMFFRGDLGNAGQVAVLLLKIGMIFFVGLSFAKMQKEHFTKEEKLTDLNNNLEAKIAARTKRIEDVTSIAIVSLAKLTESRDPETGAHLERIRTYTHMLVNELRLEDKFKDYITDKYVNELVQSSILHDIGKVGIPDSILLKEGPLTPEERKIMENHTIIGGDSLKKAHAQIGGESFLSLAQEIAYYHHEKFDGSGYPKGLKGEDIPLSARIVCVIDVYDALRSKRPYKGSLTHQAALKIMKEEMKNAFDPVILGAFERVSDNLWGAV
jgi:HD-GYP domain-containing protein (c-di-GMP phosphodiesterase class II)